MPHQTTWLFHWTITLVERKLHILCLIVQARSKAKTTEGA